MWYHFAFVAVSLAMFGITAGALIVYLLPGIFLKEKTKKHLALSTLAFGISTVVCFLSHLAMPFMPDRSLSGLFAMALSYLTISIPFIFSGIAITLVLTRFPAQLNYLYAADLAGAAVGCALFITVLNITDGPTAVLLSSLFPVCAAILLSDTVKMRRLTACICAAASLLVIANICSVQLHQPLVRLLWVKAKFEPRPYFERWNSFSRVTIDDDVNERLTPTNWGLSERMKDKPRLQEMQLLVDTLYATAIPAFTGNYKDTEYFQYDISYLAHFLRKNAKVLVIGVGGGRDILAALSFGQKSVVGVEINNIFTDMLQKTFADFSGNFIKDPRVQLVNDEARSFTSRQKDKFDIIQLCFINTGTATGAGAFALSEHSLYTQEAWQMFLDHLTDRGILTCTRNYFIDQSGHPLPGELQRFVSLARSALTRAGVTEAEKHIICVSWMPAKETGQTIGAVTMLVSKQPFLSADLDTLNTVLHDKGYTYLLASGQISDPILEIAASGKGLAELQNKYPVRLDAPTDNNPFFFYVLRFSQLFATKPAEVGTYQMYIKAMEILAELLVVVIVLTISCFIVPLLLTKNELKLTRDLPLLSFFAAIGLGFMFIEVSQLQRLIIFLGQPAYSLSVVLFSLLLSSSIGSLMGSRIQDNNFFRNSCLALCSLIAATIAYAFISPQIINMLQTASTPERIAATIAMLFPLGLCMGMAMPLGLRLAARQSPVIMPWLWGINGATSVCASVITVVVSINWGLAASYWTGVVAYLVAIGSFVCAAKKPSDS